MTPHDDEHVRSRAIAWLGRVLASPWFWGLLGWALLILRYTSDVVNPRYGGG